MSVQKVLGPRRPPLGFYTKPGLLDERPRRAERELRARAEVDDAAPEERVGHVVVSRIKEQFDRRRAACFERQFLVPAGRRRPPPARRLADLIPIRRPHVGVRRADGLKTVAAPEEPPRAVHLDDELVLALDRRPRDLDLNLVVRQRLLEAARQEAARGLVLDDDDADGPLARLLRREPLPPRPVWKSKFYGAFVLNRRVVLHAIDATPDRWRGDVGSSPLDGASAATSSCTRRAG